MDHLVEIATHLLRQMPDAAKDDLADKPTLALLRKDLDVAVARVYARQDAVARKFRERKTVNAEKEQAQADPPESARAAPGILRGHLLADLIARTPSLIPKALHEACGQKRKFYPTFLEYLMVSVEEILNPPFGRHRKWFAISEHKALIWDRHERVVDIVRKTAAWAACQERDRSQDSDAEPSDESSSDDRGVTASMLGVGALSSATTNVRERGRRAAKSLIDRVTGGSEPLQDVPDLFERDEALLQTFRKTLREELLIKPELVRELSDAAAIAVPFDVALHEELREIQQSRAARRIDPLGNDAGTHATRLSSDMNTLGLALSGGGIRSATFNLGVLQGLAHCDLLRRVDYLSTVSGGGYIGAWLASWSKRILRDDRSDPRGIDLVQERLSTEPLTEPDALSVRAVRFLREYSNYLTPQAGVFTADTWTMIAIWLRNTLLNQAVLILTLCAILGVPWMLWVAQFGLTQQTSLVDGLHAFRPCRPGLFATSPLVMTSATVLLLYASAISGQQLRRFGLSGFKRRLTRDDMLAQTGVLTGIVAPVVISAALISAALFNMLGCNTPVFTGRSVLELGSVLSASMVIFAVGGHYHHCFVADRVSTTPTRRSTFMAYLSTAFVLGIGIALSSGGGSAVVLKVTAMLGERIQQSGNTPGSLSLAFVTFGPPVVITTFSLMIVIKIGVLGRNLFDEHREWWSRLGAWLNIVSLVWVVLCVLALFSPQLVWAFRSRTAHYIAAASGGVLWAAWTAAGVLWGKAESFTKLGDGGTSRRVREWIVAAAPYAFMLGLLILLSAATFAAVSKISPGDLRPADLRTVHTLGLAHSTWMLVTPPVLLLAAFLLSWRVDINEFSMHHFYKNRLVRCYLGASRDRRADRPERRPDPFTGFDAGDDLKLAFLRSNPREDSQTFTAKRADNAEDAFPYIGPLPIINTALNLVKGDDLAWQERRAQSFVFTPFFSGYEQRRREGVHPFRAPYGFRQTALFGYPPFGTGLGTAVAISGAAASPNMGYHSSPAAAFLMTMFNARLGWWMGNPRDNRTWLRSGPRRGLLYLLNELFGLTNDSTPFVNLSDGGHFENLGIYELVRRRCRYIIACDAEQDAALHFNGLGNAIRKCRTDFGAEIEISATRIRPKEGLLSSLHCVIGDITYADGEKGTLLYLKASVTGDEPADVLEYAARETTFPHHSTMTDQFFDESQFESYRKLGFHVARTAFASPTRTAKAELPRGASTHDQLAAIFAHMRDYWHPGNPAVAERRAAHTAQYDALLSRVMDEDTFSFADSAFFAGLGAVGGVQRPSLFVGALMLDLMQRVYLDLDLENDRDHPHNSGWITIFKRWKGHPAVVAAWTASQDDYSRPFRWFYASL